MRLFLIGFSCLILSGAHSQEEIPYDSLSKVLDKIFEKDQLPRETLSRLSKQFGHNSDTVTQYWKAVDKSDSINLLQVTQIIDRYGWLDMHKISSNAGGALFYVIQHAPDVQERYLPILAKAAKSGKAKKTYYATMYDRVQMFNNKFQLYGTQYGGDRSGKTILWPVENILELNNRRKEMGLNSIENQMKDMDIKYQTPKFDSLKNKVLLFGDVRDASGRLIPEVICYDSKNSYLGISDDKGYFTVALDKSIINEGLFFKKQGFKIAWFKFSNIDDEVFYDSISLFRLQ